VLVDLTRARRGSITSRVTPEQAIVEARGDKVRPVYLVVGEERLFIDRVVAALREAAMKGGIAGFNEDKFTAGESTAGAITSACRMVPMMAKRRFVLVRGLDRWEKKGDDGGGDDEAPKPGKKGKPAESPLDELAEYAKEPADSAVLVLVATKLHGQRRLVTTTKKAGFLVSCDALPRNALPVWIQNAAKEKGHGVSPEVADHLAEIAGPELGYVSDVIERLSLFVGPKQPFTEEAVAEIVTKVRPGSVWELIDALGRRKIAVAMATLADVYDPREGGLKLLGLVTWSVRQMVKFDSALRGGSDPREAAARAGVAPFKVQEMTQTVKGIPPGTLARWLRLLAHADLALKSSKRPPQAILEAMILEMCA
jgi:DNA polymerase-3 subunit delta